MNKIRRFTEVDWYGFVGAEKFANGSEPLIYEDPFANNSANLTVVADRNGVSIMIDTENDDIIYFKESHFKSSLQAEGEIRALARVIKSYIEASVLCYDIDNENFPEFKNFFSI
jgi:hypothetical protein